MSAPLLQSLDRLSRTTRELTELKRMRDCSTTDTVAERLFRRAWSAIAVGVEPISVWPAIVADALVATRLAGIDAVLLQRLDIPASSRTDILRRSFDDATGMLDHDVAADLAASIGQIVRTADAPGFVDALIRQPRAGATSPGKPRLALEPAESHGDHCLLVGVLGALIARINGGDPARVFIAGLAHHLHNAALPDTGFAGEMMLGDALDPIMRQLFAVELATLAPTPRAWVQDALRLIVDADSPEGRAFHAADVIDRVLQAHHHARAAAFTADQALHDLELVHEGPLRPFQLEVLSTLGLV